MSNYLIVTSDAKMKGWHINFKVSKNHKDYLLIEDISGSQDQGFGFSRPRGRLMNLFT